jgi:hypothetical protein
MNNLNNPKALLKMIKDQQEVIHQLNQKVLTLSKRFSKTQLTQTLLLSLLMKHDPELLDFIENEINKMENETSYYQANTEEVTQLKKVLSNIKTIALKSKKNP